MYDNPTTNAITHQMDSVQKYLKDVGGSKRLATYFVSCNKTSVYMLFNDGIISAAMILQHGIKTTYVSYVDSTGFGRGFTTPFIISVLKQIKGLVVCFSYPKEEPIFGHSCENSQKKILDPAGLFKFWSDIFEKRCYEECKNGNLHGKDIRSNTIKYTTEDIIKNTIKNTTEDTKEDIIRRGEAGNINNCILPTVYDNKNTKMFCMNENHENVDIFPKKRDFTKHSKSLCYLKTWSNFKKNRSFPYKNLDEIEAFDDDPKSKLLKKFTKIGHKSLTDFFEGLLVKSDFRRGGLFFSYCSNCLITVSPFNHLQSLSVTDHVSKNMVNELELNKAVAILNTLRSFDFSTEALARESTDKFIEEFDIKLEYFYTNSKLTRKPINEVIGNIKKIIPRSK